MTTGLDLAARPRQLAAVVFTVDATTATGHQSLSSEEMADRAAAHADVLIPFGSVDPLDIKPEVRPKILKHNAGRLLGLTAA
jgi:predicted TIM-barrel fold metal-dependent hydrolase